MNLHFPGFRLRLSGLQILLDSHQRSLQYCRIMCVILNRRFTVKTVYAKIKNYFFLACVFLFVLPGASYGAETLGTIATTVIKSFIGIARLITAGSYLAGAAFAMGAIMKFKQHKDNPTQNPVGTPIALVFIAAALMFLPTLYNAAGVTVFGGSAQSGSLSGVTF